MKTLLTCFLAIGIFSLANAQSFVPKEFFKPELNLKQKDTTGIISEGFRSTNPLNDSTFGYKLPNPEWSPETEKKSVQEVFIYDPFRMPIMGLHTRPGSNMPVWVPDSTVNYALQIKKIGATLYSGTGAVPDSVLIQH